MLFESWIHFRLLDHASIMIQRETINHHCSLLFQSWIWFGLSNSASFLIEWSTLISSFDDSCGLVQWYNAHNETLENSLYFSHTYDDDDSLKPSVSQTLYQGYGYSPTSTTNMLYFPDHWRSKIFDRCFHTNISLSTRLCSFSLII
jgi:hypothetical protein